MRKPGLLLCALVLLAACQSGTPSGTVSPKSQAIVRCGSGDQPVEERVLGWGFCYPATWRALERQQSTTAPKGIDATFDITEYQQGPDLGKFGYMIISTDDRAGAPTLAQWVQTYVGSGVQIQPIQWGDAVEAAREVNGDRRFALTKHQVVILELRSGPGNLDLESAMSARLDTWRFIY